MIVMTKTKYAFPGQYASYLNLEYHFSERICTIGFGAGYNAWVAQGYRLSH